MKSVQEFATALFEIQINAHIAHLQTTSYAQHKALNSLYEDIVEIIDSFLESYQGKYGIIKGYKSFSIKEGVEPSAWLKTYTKPIEEFRLSLKDGYLQQLCDDLLELLNSTIYKLRFLN